MAYLDYHMDKEQIFNSFSSSKHTEMKQKSILINAHERKNIQTDH